MNEKATVENADVLIVGAGPSGAVAAYELARKGFKVVCLEQGDWNLPDDFTGDKPQWDLARLKQWHPSPNTRGNEADYPINAENSPLEPLLFNGVGGSSILYSGHWVRALPSDFRVKTLDGVAEDWPFTYEDLRPFYDEVTHHIGASGLEGDPSYPDSHTFPLPPLPIGKDGLRRGARHGQARLALVAGPQRHLLACLPEPARLPAVRRLRVRLPRRRQGQC